MTSGRARRRPQRLFGLVAASALTLLACVPHAIGPARTFGTYHNKAVATAESALSSVETVRLASEAGSAGNAFAPYLSVLISDQEDALADVQSGFASIQPPDTRSDRLRTELDDLLGTALDHVADVRIAARRSHIDELAVIGRPLVADAAALGAFVAEHSS